MWSISEIIQHVMPNPTGLKKAAATFRPNAERNRPKHIGRKQRKYKPRPMDPDEGAERELDKYV